MAGTAVTVQNIADSVASEPDSVFRTQLNNIITDLETLRTGLAEFVGSATWDPGSIADGNEEAVDVTVTGVALGDFVTAVSFSLDVADLVLVANVTATNTVTCILANNTGGAVDLSSGTVRVRVSSQGLVDAAADLVASTINTWGP